MRAPATSAPLLAAALAAALAACAHAKPAGPLDRILAPGDFLVRVHDAEAYELAQVKGPATGELKRLALVPSGQEVVGVPMRVRAAEPADLKPGAVVYWTGEGRSGDAQALRRADWYKGTVRRVDGQRVQLGGGREADAGWHVLVPLVPQIVTDAEPTEPK